MLKQIFNGHFENIFFTVLKQNLVKKYPRKYCQYLDKIMNDIIRKKKSSNKLQKAAKQKIKKGEEKLEERDEKDER